MDLTKEWREQFKATFVNYIDKLPENVEHIDLTVQKETFSMRVRLPPDEIRAKI